MTRRRRRRGFTLVELVVASSLITVGVLTILAVVIQLNDQAAAELTRADMNRARVQVDTLLARDIAAAATCHPSRAEPVLRHASPNRLSWTVTDPDGTISLVTWELSGGYLLRYVAADESGCVFADEPTPTVVAHGLWPADDAPAGLYVTDPASGEPVDVGDSCVTLDYYTTCAHAARVRLDVVATSRDDTRYVLRREWALPSGRSRLR